MLQAFIKSLSLAEVLARTSHTYHLVAMAAELAACIVSSHSQVSASSLKNALSAFCVCFVQLGNMAEQCVFPSLRLCALPHSHPHTLHPNMCVHAYVHS